MDRKKGIQLLRDAERLDEVKPVVAATELQGLAGWALGLVRGLSSERKVEQKQLQLMETLSLGGKKQLMLVSCAGQRFLVGGGPESVETIVRVSDEPSLKNAAKNLDESWQ
jgi:hypothetical protein